MSGEIYWATQNSTHRRNVLLLGGNKNLEEKIKIKFIACVVRNKLKHRNYKPDYCLQGVFRMACFFFSLEITFPSSIYCALDDKVLKIREKRGKQTTSKVL